MMARVDKYKNPIISYIPEQHFSNQQLQIPSLQSLITMDFAPNEIFTDLIQCAYHEPLKQKIRWDMWKILDHKCWKCQHWEFLSYYERYHCNLNSQNLFYSEDFPQYVTWDQIHSKNIVQHGDIVIYTNYKSTQQSYKIDDCPCYSESQEYHEWKEQQAFLKVKGSQISL